MRNFKMRKRGRRLTKRCFQSLLERSPSLTLRVSFGTVSTATASGETYQVTQHSSQQVARTKFDKVWAVLQAMQEQDEVLDDLINQMQAERRLTKDFRSDSRLRERVEVLGPR